MAELKENAIEWFMGDDFMFCTFSQRKYINKAKKYLQQNPSFDGKLIENQDGSICVRLPLKLLGIRSKIPSGTGVFKKADTEDEEGEE